LKEKKEMGVKKE